MRNGAEKTNKQTNCGDKHEAKQAFLCFISNQASLAKDERYLRLVILINIKANM